MTQTKPKRNTKPTVDEVALALFSKIYMDTSGRKAEHIAERAYEAAEAFVEVANKRHSPARVGATKE